MSRLLNTLQPFQDCETRPPAEYTSCAEEDGGGLSWADAHVGCGAGGAVPNGSTREGADLRDGVRVEPLLAQQQAAAR